MDLDHNGLNAIAHETIHDFRCNGMSHQVWIGTNLYYDRGKLAYTSYLRPKTTTTPNPRKTYAMSVTNLSELVVDVDDLA